MHKEICRKKVIILLVITFFLYLFPLLSKPTTENFYYIPEEHFQLDSGLSYINDAGIIYTIGFGAGITHRLSIFFEYNIICYSQNAETYFDSADSFFKAKYFLFADSDFLLGFQTNIRLPVDGNSNIEYYGFGRNELSFGLESLYRLDKINIINTVFYHFCQSTDKFYNNLYFNIFQKQTYDEIFGLNLKSQDSFLFIDYLKNDYFDCSMTINSGHHYPFVPSAEVRILKRISNSEKLDKLSMYGSDSIIIQLATGLAYNFSENLNTGLYLSRIGKEGHNKSIYVLNLISSIVF